MNKEGNYCFKITDFEKQNFKTQQKINNGDFNIEGLISGNYWINAFRGKKNIDINLRIEYKRKFLCSRCLEEFVEERNIYRKVEAVENVNVSLPFEGQKINEEEDENLIYFDGETINLYNILKDLIVLDEEMKLLCSEQCRGLCPVCGINLNKKQCSCTVEKSSKNPFDILATLDDK
ncbi:MAG: YceD family protein [bacterium]